MPGFRINGFSGEMPRNNPRLMNQNVAELALDVNLDQGTLRPWRDRLRVSDQDFDVLSMFLTDCCWLASDKCADYALVSPACPLVVRTGVAAYPEIATFEQACANIWCRLGVPCPDVAITASPADPAPPIGYSTTMRSYRYSWVNKFDQEGGGSPPSVSFDVVDGAAVMLQIPPCPADPSYCVTNVKIYRTGTPFESGGETSNPQNTEWYLVDVVGCGVSVYVDTKREIDLSVSGGDLAIFTREESIPPPADLHSVVSMENGCLCGISGEFVVQSETYLPHSWPLKFYKKLWQGDEPKRCVSVKNTLYVATAGHPYTIETTPDCNTDGRQGVWRHREPMPIVGGRSMAAGSGLAYYASEDGLVALAGAAARVVSEQLWSKEQWQKLHPNLMIGAIFDGFYFGFSDVYGFRLKTTEPEHFDKPETALTRLSDRPKAMWVSPDGFLYMAIGTAIERWNAGDRWRPYLWICTEMIWARRTSLSAAYAVIRQPGALEITHVTDRGDYARTVVNDDLFRLPDWMSVATTKIKLRGTAEVTEFATGTSFKEAYRAGATV
jgi:transposase-like protein